MISYLIRCGLDGGLDQYVMLKRFPNDGTGRQFQKRSSRKKRSDIIIRQVLARYRVKSHYVIYVISAYMTATALLIFEIH